MKTIILLSWIILIAVGKLGLATDRPTSHPNLYVNLYLQRVFEAEAMIQKAAAELELQNAKLNMARRLRPSGAISEDEYNEQVAKVGIAAANLQQMKAFLGESESLYQLALVLTETGKEMPICVH